MKEWINRDRKTRVGVQPDESSVQQTWKGAPLSYSGTEQPWQATSPLRAPTGRLSQENKAAF